MQSLLQDLRYGWRVMWKSPGFTMAAVVTLALGIGANSAIFSIVNVLTLKPLPYHDPSRVAFLLGWDIDESEMRFNLRLADYFDLGREARSFESLAAYTYLSANLTGGDLPERVQAYRVTPNTFSMLGVPAALGRVFDGQDTSSPRDDVAVISRGLWQRRFGGDPSIVGRRVLLNGEPHEIIGVMPPRFEYPVFNFKGDVWVPWRPRDGGRGEAAGTRSATVVGRVRAGVSYASAQAELDTLMRTLAADHPGDQPRPRRPADRDGTARRRAGGTGDHDRAGHGGARAAARVRERRQSAARPRDRPTSRTGGARGRRRQPLAHRPPVAGRGGAARARRRRCRHRARRRGAAGAAGGAARGAAGDAAQRGRDRDRSRHARLHPGGGARHQRRVRAGARLARRPRQLPGQPEGIGRGRRRPRHTPAAQRAGDRRGGAVDAAPHRCRPAGAHLQRTAADRSRFCAPGGADPGAEPARLQVCGGPAAGAVLRPDPRGDRAAARRPLGGIRQRPALQHL